MNQTGQLHWLEISRSALLHNLSQYRHHFSPQTKIMAMVKANAYGHGLNEISGILKNKADFFAVNTVSEALTIRVRDKKTPILITAPVSSSDFHSASQNHISLCIPSLDYLSQLTASNLKLAAHLKINTGTNRLGLSPLELLPAVDILRHSKQLTVEGIYTHFHSSDSGSPQSLIQLDIFNQAVSQTKYYFPKSIAHCSSSSSALLWPRAHLDMIRVGIALYGLWPDKFVKSHAPPKFTLKPVLSWFCRPVQIRRVDTGETVGYSATYTYHQPGVMAILPIGYSDGYDRKLSNAGRVWTRGVSCPVIGRIAMNFTAIDLSKLEGYADRISPSSRIEIIGSHITADEIATALGTINYEVVSRLNPAIPRLIVK
jgi:alanine racemase